VRLPDQIEEIARLRLRLEQPAEPRVTTRIDLGQFLRNAGETPESPVLGLPAELGGSGAGGGDRTGRRPADRMQAVVAGDLGDRRR
jgi:hypothetical protein